MALPNGGQLINPNPVVYEVVENSRRRDNLDDLLRDEIDSLEVFEIVRKINDPEHPLTLEQLNVVKAELIKVSDDLVHINFTPTIPHCSMATLIGLCLRVKLLRSLPERYKVDIEITPGTHSSESAVNKQLNDKERVAAALENPSLLNVVNQCIAHTD
jgi:metal-sulfur cluster biosynthetic enzyme